MSILRVIIGAFHILDTGGNRNRTAQVGPFYCPLDRKVYVGIVSPAGFSLEDNSNTIESVQENLADASSYWASQTVSKCW